MKILAITINFCISIINSKAFVARERERQSGLYKCRHITYFMSVLSFALLVFEHPETSFNPTAFSTLSHQFDQIIQDFDKSDSKPNSYSKDLSIEPYCTLSSIAISGAVSHSLFLLIINNEILNVLKKLTQKFVSLPETMSDKLNAEKERLETWIADIADFSKTPLKKVSEQKLTAKNKEELNQTIKKLAIDTLIEMLAKTINLPRGTSDFSQRSPAATLEQKLHVLFRKITDEQIQEGDSPESIERKFNNIKSLLEDRILLMGIPLFPVLHLEPEMVSGIREMPAIHPSETRIPRDPSFQEIQADRDRLNSLIKQLLKGETGYINNRSATSLVVHPERRSYPIQFSKELFPAFLFLNMIQKVIEEIEALPTSTFNLQDLSRPPAIEPDDNINTVAQGIL